MLDTVIVKLCIVGIIVVFLFLILLLNQAKKAKTAKFKKYSYISAGVICGPLLLAFIAIAFDQFILFILFTLAAFLFSLIMIPFITEQRKIETAEIMKSIDASKPLSIRDIFSQNIQYKLVKKYDIRKATAIYTAMIIGFGGIGIAILFLILYVLDIPPFSYFLDINWWIMPVYFLTLLAILSIISYFQFKGELKNISIAYSNVTSCNNYAPSLTTQTTVTYKFCPTCGTPVESGANYCVQCGKQL